jgi:hypothetical protein
MFCLATGAADAPPDLVEVVAADVVARAIAAGVRAARSLPEVRHRGFPAAQATADGKGRALFSHCCPLYSKNLEVDSPKTSLTLCE